MAANGEVKFYLDRVRLRVNEAEGQSLEAIAHLVEGQAKANVVSNGQVDTGFMLNAIYVVTEESSSYNAAKGEAKGRNPNAEMGGRVNVLPGTAGVVAGASYSIYQEAHRSFLYKAGEQVVNQVEGTVERIGREVIRD